MRQRGTWATERESNSPRCEAPHSLNILGSGKRERANVAAADRKYSKRNLDYRDQNRSVNKNDFKEDVEMDVLGGKAREIHQKVSVAKEAMEALHHLRQIQKIMPPDLVRKSDKKIKARQTLNESMSIRATVFLLLEDPSFSRLAKFISGVILGFILLSCISFIIETLPRYSYPRYGNEVGDHPPIFGILDTLCLAVFTCEYFLRLLTVGAVPDLKLRDMGYDIPMLNMTNRGDIRLKAFGWMKNPMNLVDLLSIMPILFLIFDSNGGAGFQVVRVLRLTRAFRVFKLGKYSEGLILFHRVIAKSLSALYLLFFFMLISTIVFGSTIYYAERGNWDDEKGYYVRPDLYGDGTERSPFTSIPRSFWWVIVTSTTVGYGDMVPRTTTGRFVGTLAMYFGILVLAMPLAIISSNFQRVHEEFRKQKQGYRNTANGMSSRMLELILSLENINTELKKIFQELKALSGRYLNLANHPDMNADSIESERGVPTNITLDEGKLVLHEFLALQDELQHLLMYKKTVLARIRRLSKLLVIERQRKKRVAAML
mmetsp:Transcript_24374/g.39284  ORF Transcript_24374/g.39284 Transcript_24374/m.39284 type:complete len:543 (-) Transcript_24374:246-1874(-)